MIPKRIIMTAKSRIVPQRQALAISSWISLNPDYAFEFYDDNAIDDVSNDDVCHDHDDACNDVDTCVDNEDDGDDIFNDEDKT